MKFIKLIFLCYFCVVTSTSAQTSSEIKNDGDSNKYDIKQIGTDKSIKSKIENKGGKGSFKIDQDQKNQVSSIDTSKIYEMNKNRPVKDIAEDSNAVIGVGISLLTALGLWFGLKDRFKSKKPKT